MISSKKKEVKTRLGKEMIKVAEYLLENNFFGDIRRLTKALGKEYVTLDLTIRRIIERNFLIMRFSTYRMNLDRYTIFAKVKEQPREREEFEKLVLSLPYNPWLRYAGIQAIPQKTLMLTYTIPAGSPIDKIVGLLESHPEIDKNEEIEVYKLNYSYYTKPEKFSRYLKYGVIKTMTEAKEEIWKTLERKTSVDYSEAIGIRDDPIDIEDIVIMSYLEQRYPVTPIWLYRKRGGLRLGAKTIRYHFRKHIKNRYYLGVYLQRPPNPEILDTVYISIVKGRDAKKIGYKLSKTPYSLALCDFNKNICLIQFYCDEHDMSLVNEILSSHRVSILKDLITFKRNMPGYHERRTISYITYARNAKRWYDLDEAVVHSSLAKAKVIKKYLKVERIPEDRLPK